MNSVFAFVGLLGVYCAFTAVTLDIPSSNLEVPPESSVGQYRWLPQGKYDAKQSLVARFPAPAGYERVQVAPGSFGGWLRHLPLLPAGTPVHLYTGQLKHRQDVHAAVLNLDTGTRDLQQCADAVIRLRGEYQFSQDADQVHFHLTSGHDIRFQDWYSGRTFRVVGDDVEPATKPMEAPTHPVFRRYLDQIFTYAGTLSLSRELMAVPLSQVLPGDVLIRGGSPGHAVLVLDVAVQAGTGRRKALLAQSYMPAQQVHVLKAGPQASSGAWFSLDPSREQVFTPEWTFRRDELKRFE
ncbi:DUF4846 domain-containing protein [Hymenobacter taeanensis]|uniref:DUF4846 domain-containing protein n=1 Tax=Hymenobacter taeanensis TaxID=2735321 RepID=A0A6M6BI77_9BACT|nr:MULTISPECIES: DUF4846 domain-containing protein [Hymenobacter]QJX48301.1 DUF4846 domain-containing protein [Hymenobacter taeanensis]UOQ82207.1 DUF4846 domain-containing protein [Hymenobacter sp. 5414T-23]